MKESASARLRCPDTPDAGHPQVGVAGQDSQSDCRHCPAWFPDTGADRDSLGVALDAAAGKTISYLYEDHRLLEGPNRSPGRVPADGPYRTGAGVRRRASRSGGLSPRPACGSAERGRHRLAARLSAEGLLRAHRLRVDGCAVKYLVDANILSEPTKPTPDPRVVAWLRANEPDIAVDPVILGELRFGILILPKGRRRTALERWFDAGAGRLHCLSWDADTGLKWADLLARLRPTAVHIV